MIAIEVTGYYGKSMVPMGRHWTLLKFTGR
jgi:hypothetical protein